MPYIESSRRKVIETDLASLLSLIRSSGDQFTKGDLNYTVTRLVMTWLVTNGQSYSHMSDVTGILSDIQAEFRRRVMDPYEDLKKDKYGEVFY